MNSSQFKEATYGGKIQQFRDNNDPNLVIDLGREHTVNIYRRGSGWLALIFFCGASKPGGVPMYRQFDYRTNAVEKTFEFLKVYPRHWEPGSETPWQYKLGGNYYQVPPAHCEKGILSQETDSRLAEADILKYRIDSQILHLRGIVKNYLGDSRHVAHRHALTLRTALEDTMQYFRKEWLK